MEELRGLEGQRNFGVLQALQTSDGEEAIPRQRVFHLRFFATSY